MTNTNNYYITTPIYYVNGQPHIGHAYTTLICDSFARYMRLTGKKTRYLTGTDEHGQKVQKTAEQQNISPLQLCDNISNKFQEMLKIMNISNDDFIRTTQDRHKEYAKKFWQKLEDSGNIYLGKYSGWYAVRDEAFYQEDELREDGKAPTGADVQWLEEESYFFALSKFEEKLLAFYEQNPDFIQPNTRRNEVISFVKSGLKDLSISRTSFDWGIQVPTDKNKKHIMYVWLDALSNYISALGGEDSDLYKEFWPANVHIVGKDILRFHAVYWPAFLMAAELPLPKVIFAHGWWMSDGQKMSKSLGNIVDPMALINEFGVDQFRFGLMREMNFGNDGNFVLNNFIMRNNSELSNKIGNLSQRTCSFLYKNNEGKYPHITTATLEEIYKNGPLAEIEKIVAQNFVLMNQMQINQVLDNIIAIADQANCYFDQEAPWVLAKTDIPRMLHVLYITLEYIRNIALMLLPFIPESAGKMLDTLAIAGGERNLTFCGPKGAVLASAESEHIIQKPQAIFPRFELDNKADSKKIL